MNQLMYWIRYIALSLFFTGIGVSSKATDDFFIEEETPSGRVSFQKVDIDPNDAVCSLDLKGCPITCLFGGPHISIDSLTIFPQEGDSLPSLFGEWTKELNKWAVDTCKTKKYTKISVDIPNDLVLKETIKNFLKEAGFEEKTLIYKINVEVAKFRWKEKYANKEDFSNIYPLNLDSPFLDSAQSLFDRFNPTMALVPGLFRTSLEETWRKGGRGYIHKNSENGTVDGIIALAPFIDKENNPAWYVDTLYVDESQRGKSIAVELIGKLLIESGGIPTIYWETGLGRQEAQNFYSQIGLQPYGTAFRYTPPVINQVRSFLPDVLKILTQDPKQVGKALDNIFQKFNNKRN